MRVKEAIFGRFWYLLWRLCAMQACEEQTHHMLSPPKAT